jgi:hypothetical protein
MGRAISPTENHLKAQLLNELRRAGRISSTTILANELPVGMTGVRADLAIFAKNLTGVEIKSGRDSLKRLTHQLPVYRAYFDRTILVLESKHWGQTADLDLSGVEIWIASGLTLRRVQPGALSKKTSNQVSLLPATATSRFKTFDPNARESELLFRKAFVERFKSTSEAFWFATQGRRIESSDLTLLSRFMEKRQQLTAMANDTKKARKEWLEELAQSTQSSSVSKNDASSQ